MRGVVYQDARPRLPSFVSECGLAVDFMQDSWRVAHDL